VSLLEVVAAVEGLLVTGLAVFLVKRGLRNPGTWVLGGLLLAFGLFTLFVMVPHVFDADPPGGAVLAAVVLGILVTSLLWAFPVVYPDWTLSARKRWYLLWAFIPTGVVAGHLVLARDLVIDAGGTPTPFMGTLEESLLAGAYLVGTVVFGRAWLRLEPGTYRRQFLFVLASFMLWNVNDGTYVLVGTLRPSLVGGRPFPEIVILLNVLQLLVAVALAGLVAYRAARRAGETGADDRLLVLIVGLGTIPTALQFLGSTIHFLWDGLITVILFYGVAKYRILDLDLKVKITIRRGALGGAAGAIMLIVQQAVEQYAGSEFGESGILVGAAVAGIALFALTPLQRFAEKLGDKAMPQVENTDAYFTYRRVELYRVALEGMMRDGHLDLKETRALVALREELRITAADHDRLEEELRSKLRNRAAAATTPTPA